MIGDRAFPRFGDDVVVPKRRIRIRMPKQPPEPPDKHCALCDTTRPWHWFFGHPSIPVCHGCMPSGRNSLANGMDFRDATVIDQAKAVIKRLGTEHGPHR